MNSRRRNIYCRCRDRRSTAAVEIGGVKVQVHIGKSESRMFITQEINGSLFEISFDSIDGNNETRPSRIAMGDPDNLKIIWDPQTHKFDVSYQHFMGEVSFFQGNAQEGSMTDFFTQNYNYYQDLLSRLASRFPDEDPARILFRHLQSEILQMLGE